MSITIPATITISADNVSVLRQALEGGQGSIPPVDGLNPGERYLDVEFPDAWRPVEQRTGETYHWPNLPLEQYAPFTVFEGSTTKGSIRLGIGRCQRAPVFGKDRLYLITFHMTAGGKRPLCEFVEVDDYRTTQELVAIIRGNGPSQRSMYPPTSVLPGPYGKLPTALYADRIKFRGSYKQQAVVAREDDVDTMLNHSLVQADLRFAIKPS
jgi:hypothetical protein